jgi:hypothetical protein
VLIDVLYGLADLGEANTYGVEHQSVVEATARG